MLIKIKHWVTLGSGGLGIVIIYLSRIYSKPRAVRMLEGTNTCTQTRATRSNIWWTTGVVIYRNSGVINM